MNDKEKQAIKDCDLVFISLEDMMSEDGANKYRASYQIVKKLIEKQQNEIEEKDEVIKKKFLHDYKEINEMIDNNFINKTKIREKMEEVKDLSTAGYEILKELLEE